MEETRDSAIKLVVLKSNPITAQEEHEETYNWGEFEDWEVVEEPSALTKMMRKLREVCSRSLLDALLIFAAIMMGASVIMKQTVLAAIAAGLVALVMVIAMFRIVKPAKN